jgi:hypothetical protein
MSHQTHKQGVVVVLMIPRMVFVTPLLARNMMELLTTSLKTGTVQPKARRNHDRTLHSHHLHLSMLETVAGESEGCRAMNVETIYPSHVTAYRDFLLAEIQRIEQAAQAELRQSRIASPEMIKAKHREVLTRTQPLHDELIRLLSITTCNYLLTREFML